MWRRRRSLRASSDRWVNSCPPTITRPFVGVSSPAIRLRSVLLPEPLGPMMETNWLAGTCRLTSLNAVTAWPASPYLLLTRSRTTAGVSVMTSLVAESDRRLEPGHAARRKDRRDRAHQGGHKSDEAELHVGKVKIKHVAQKVRKGPPDPQCAQGNAHRTAQREQVRAGLGAHPDAVHLAVIPMTAVEGPADFHGATGRGEVHGDTEHRERQRTRRALEHERVVHPGSEVEREARGDDHALAPG